MQPGWESIDKESFVIDLYSNFVIIPDLKLIMRFGMVSHKIEGTEDLSPKEYEKLDYYEKFEPSGYSAYVIYDINDEFNPQNYLLFQFEFRGVLFFLEDVYAQWDPAKRPTISVPIEDLPCEIITDY